MSGISPIASTATPGSPGSLPASNLSAVGQSLETTGAAPAATPAAPPASSTPSTYRTQYENLQVYDTQELLYASFLSPADGLANADAVLGQAATLLGVPGSEAPAQSASAQAPSAAAPSTADPVAALPSVSSLLAASDNTANQTLAAYANAPAGTPIIDVQA